MKTEDIAIERHLRRPLPNRRDIVAVLFRQRMVIVAAFALAVLATFAAGLWNARYDSHMKILVQRQRSNAIVTSSSTEPVQFSNEPVTEEDLNTEVELLNSEDLLRQVVVSTGLAGKPGPASDPKTNIRIAKAMGELVKNLTIEPLHKSNVIAVRYRARNPQKGAEVLQALAAAYTEKHMESRSSSAEFKFFDQQTQQFEQGLNKAQDDLTSFTKGTGVVSADIERDSALRQANDFDTTARQAQTAVIETENRIRTLQGQLQTIQPRITTVVRTSDNAQLLEHLKSTLLSLQLKRTELLTKYDPAYRLVQEVDQQIAETKNAIASEESKPIRDESSDQDPNYASVKAELTKAQDDLNGLKARAAAAASISEQYHQAAQRLDKSGVVQQDLKRAVKTQEDNYLLYEHKREEARINQALDQRGILNVSVAEQPTVPVLRNRSRLNLAILTLLVAGTFSLTTAFVVDFMDPSFRTPDELANYLGTPVLAALPKGESR